MFSTTLNDEYAIASELLGLDAAGVAELARAGVRASFLDDAGKAGLLAEIDAYAIERCGKLASRPGD
jgi:adenosine deaminase